MPYASFPVSLAPTPKAPSCIFSPTPGPNPPIAALIPAHNEAGRIGQVLAILKQVNLLSEIIVIDDGSTDDTTAEAQRIALAEPRLRLVRHATNQGKGAAMLSGAGVTQCEILLFLDADLANLEPEHVLALVQPVYQGQADMTLGLFCGGRWHTDLSHWATPWLTGQRCLRAELLAQVSLQSATGYGIETAISLAARRYNWRCQHVALPGVSHPSSEFHRGFWQGVRRRSKMYADIYAVWRAERGRELFIPPFFSRTRLILLLLVLLLVSSLLYARQWL